MKNRPLASQVPIGAEWLNKMPTGDGWFPNQPQQPVVELQYRPGTTEQVVEYLYAEIQKKHLGKGTVTDKTVRDWVQTVVGRRTDDAGHIIGKNQGGLGTVKWNIFPQNGEYNRGAYAQNVESVFNDTVQRYGTAKIWFRFSYGNAREPCRPTRFNYFLVHANGSTTHDDLPNP
jgi:hypothetical protein